MRTALLLSLLICVSAAAEDVNLQYRFTSVEKWTPASAAALKDKGWRLNKPADQDAAFFVTTEKLGPIDGYLSITDVVDSAAIKGNDLDGTPMATLTLGKMGEGKLEIAFATDGVQKQVAAIALMDGDKVLAEIAIDNNTAGRFIAGDKETPFTDAKSWYRSPRRVELKWVVDKAGEPGKASFTFHPAGKDAAAVTVTDQALASAGIPDRIRLKVGFGTAVNRSLLIDELRITGKTTSP